MSDEYLDLVNDLMDKLYIALKEIGVDPFGRTMHFRKIKNKSTLSLNIDERNNQIRKIMFTFIVNDGFYKMDIQANRSLSKITLMLLPLIENHVREFFINIESLNKEEAIFLAPIRKVIRKDEKKTRNILSLFRK